MNRLLIQKVKDKVSMEYFLEKIAKSLNKEFGNNLNSHCLVFPNRRAGLYFMKYLAAEIEKPLWIPAIMTINELFRSYSGYRVAENEQLLYELYKVYRNVSKSTGSFDDFYYWGDMLINDFDDVDKYMVDASLLFRNVEDIKNIDSQFGELTNDQIDIIRHFWTNFNPGSLTDEKSGFIKIWSVLSAIYTQFRNSLREKNLAYEGMIFRDTAENSDTGLLLKQDWTMVHFIGFNALNNCEKTLMTSFKTAGIGRFYWDYDNSYITGGKLRSAGLFLVDNIRHFGNDMPADWNYNTLLSAGPEKAERRVIDTSSDVAQVKLIPGLIKEIPDLSDDNAHHTAVILADENLLMPVLTSLPGDSGNVNITMGYPMKQTQVYSFVKHLLLLQKNARKENGSVYFSYTDVLSILKNELLADLIPGTTDDLIESIKKNNLAWISPDYFSQSEALCIIFSMAETPAQLSVYLKTLLAGIYGNGEAFDSGSGSQMHINVRNEFIYRVILSLNRLESVISDPGFTVTIPTYIRILDKILRNQSVPFSGEPLSGIQIMGILETRTLDFKNIIMLSVNEGVLPSVSAGSSFIPFNLRTAFGLPDINHQESIFSYHFYRLLQRAENVTLIYNSNPEGMKTGEMSRYILQMKYDSSLKPGFRSVGFEIKTATSLEEFLTRTDEHSQVLLSQYCGQNNPVLLSPTAINTWLSCRMKFYYHYVCRLKEPEKVSADVDAAMLGNLLHVIMKRLYDPYTGSLIDASVIERLRSDARNLEKEISGIVASSFGEGGPGITDGRILIAKDILKEYVRKILRTDSGITPFRIVRLEEKFSFSLGVSLLNNVRVIRTGGVIDRVDSVDGIIRIVDYKTGKVGDKINSVSGLFVDDRPKENDAWLQILMYCEAYISNNEGIIARPSVYRIRETAGEGVGDRLRIRQEKADDIIVDDYGNVREIFMYHLNETVNTIFSDGEPFVMTSDRKKCTYCPYKNICVR